MYSTDRHYEIFENQETGYERHKFNLIDYQRQFIYKEGHFID